jgi:hypothetical protein
MNRWRSSGTSARFGSRLQRADFSPNMDTMAPILLSLSNWRLYELRGRLGTSLARFLRVEDGESGCAGASCLLLLAMA